MYPVYMIRAAIKKPETLLAPSNVLKAAPMARKRAVMHMAVAKTMTQNVKKAPASMVKPTMKYRTREKIDT